MNIFDVSHLGQTVSPDVIAALRQQIEVTFQQDPFVISQMGADGSVPLSVIQQVSFRDCGLISVCSISVLMYILVL